MSHHARNPVMLVRLITNIKCIPLFVLLIQMAAWLSPVKKDHRAPLGKGRRKEGDGGAARTVDDHRSTNRLRVVNRYDIPVGGVRVTVGETRTVGGAGGVEQEWARSVDSKLPVWREDHGGVKKDDGRARAGAGAEGEGVTPNGAMAVTRTLARRVWDGISNGYAYYTHFNLRNLRRWQIAMVSSAKQQQGTSA